MRNFTRARYLAAERKLHRAAKLIAEAQSSISECSRGDYRARDENRIKKLRSAYAALSNSLWNISNAIDDSASAVPGGVHNEG